MGDNPSTLYVPYTGATTSVDLNSKSFTTTGTITGGVGIFSPILRTSGSASYFTVNAPADTGIIANTESIGVNFVGAIRTWADGTVVTQRECLFQAPTYNKTTSAATFVNVAALAISGSPIAGSGVTLTHPWALWVQGGNSHFGGQVGETQFAIGGTGAEFNDSNNTIGGHGVVIQNTSNGTSAYSGISLGNNLSVDGGATSHFAGFFWNSSTYNDSTFGTAFAIPNLAALQNSDGPITISAQNATGYINFLCGGSDTTNEVARYTRTQHLLGVQIAWNIGLGAINHIIGPTDQSFVIKASVPVQQVTAIAGNNLTISASAAIAAAGGASGGAAGGTLTLNGGAGAGLTAGTSNGGPVNINGGAVGSGNNSTAGGSINLTGGATSGSGTVSTGGDIILLTGAGSSGTSSRAGNITLTVGSAGSTQTTATNNIGSITLTSGAARAISTSGATGNTGGSITENGGSGGNATNNGGGIGGLGGGLSYLSGSGGSATGSGGTRTGGNSGAVIIGSGVAGTGTTANGVGGTVSIQTNATTRLSFTDTLATYATPVKLQTGTTAAGTAPLKFVSGTNLTSAEAGAMEFTTDDYYLTITTGAARKGIILNNGANLTSGTIPVATTNGRLQDSGFTSSNILTKTATVTATGQSADIGSTNLTTTGAGLYRLAYYLVDSVADLTAGAVRLNVTYTDAGAAQTQQSATVALATLGTFTQGELIIQLASGNIAYSTTHTGILGTAAYNLYLTLERLN